LLCISIKFGGNPRRSSLRPGNSACESPADSGYTLSWMRMWMWMKFAGSTLIAVVVALLGAGQTAAEQCDNVLPWINEVDYDDDYYYVVLLNWDREEFVEIAGAAGTDLGGY
jgi:hypothetical protein